MIDRIKLQYFSTLKGKTMEIPLFLSDLDQQYGKCFLPFIIASDS